MHRREHTSVPCSRRRLSGPGREMPGSLAPPACRRAGCQRGVWRSAPGAPIRVGAQARGGKPIRLRLNRGAPSSSFMHSRLTRANDCLTEPATCGAGKQAQTYRLSPAARGSRMPRRLPETRSRPVKRAFSGGFAGSFPQALFRAFPRDVFAVRIRSPYLPPFPRRMRTASASSMARTLAALGVVESACRAAATSP